MIVCTCIVLYEFLILASVMNKSPKYSCYILVLIISSGINLLIFLSQRIINNNWINAIMLALILIPICTFLICHKKLYLLNYNIDKNGNRSSFFHNKKVLFFFPHPDDEINIAGMTLKKFANENNNSVKVCYITNGDYYDLGKQRINEALKSLSLLNVDCKDVFFLGYGDKWKKGEKHIYNQQNDVIIQSNCGRKMTYGTEVIKDFHYLLTGRHAAYTKSNLKNDIRDLILHEKPDYIFCVDFDTNADHRATSLIVEEVLGEVLKKNREYLPRFFKGFSYYTAYRSIDDFYNSYLLSTIKPLYLDSTFYDWEDRVRIPATTDFLSYTKRSNLVFDLFKQHKSQNVMEVVGRVANSDQVFWERPCNNYLLYSKIYVSSGNSDCLNDFKLYDCADVMIKSLTPLDYNVDGYWRPDKEDEQRLITIKFEKRVSFNQIRIYNNCTKNAQIKNVNIELSDGSSCSVDILNKICKFTVEASDIEYLSLRFKDVFPENVGISEIEILPIEKEINNEIIKITNEEGHFIYKLNAKKNKKYELHLYTYPLKNDFSNINIDVTDGIQMLFNQKQGIIQVKLRENVSEGKIRARDNISGNYDEISIAPNQVYLLIALCQVCEYFLDIVKNVFYRIKFWYVINRRKRGQNGTK